MFSQNLFSRNLKLFHFGHQKLLKLFWKFQSQKFANWINFSQSILKICIVCVSNLAWSTLPLMLKFKLFIIHLIYTSIRLYLVQLHSKSLFLLSLFLFSLTVLIISKLKCYSIIAFIDFTSECILNSICFPAYFKTCLEEELPI